MTIPLRLAPISSARRRFAGFAWGVLAFNLAVILWGAVVRATGSGAGCGSHWPRCDGAVVPALADSETAIEFVHRMTSGLAVLAGVGLAVWAFRAFPPGDVVRRAAGVVVGLLLFEALIGAALVLFGWVEDDASVGRIITIAVHQASTLLLIAALTVVAWWSSGGPRPAAPVPRRALRPLGIGLAALVVVAALGAITALGDTLFPAESLAEGLRADGSAQAQILVRLRVIHPALAIVAGIYLAAAGRRLAPPEGNTSVLAATVAVAVGLQILAGFVNVAFLAPLWMQIVHLLLADLLTIGVVLLAASVLSGDHALPEAARNVAA